MSRQSSQKSGKQSTAKKLASPVMALSQRQQHSQWLGRAEKAENQ